MNRKLRAFRDLFIYDIPRYFKNIYRFRYTLWNTYEFDYSGGFYALRDHFKQLEPCLRNGYHKYGDKTADRVKICINLLDRIIEDTDQYHFDKFECDWEKGFTDDGLRKTTLLNIKQTPKYSQAPRKSKLQMQILEGKEKQDIELLFKILTKHIKSFWD